MLRAAHTVPSGEITMAWNRSFRTFTLAATLALASAVAWALPSVQEVQAAVDRGDYTQAQRMMQEVVQAKPSSAKAHYVYAEILARNREYSLASRHVEQARALDSSLSFTDPQTFYRFEQSLRKALQASGNSSASGLNSAPAPAFNSGTAAPAPAAAPVPATAATASGTGSMLWWGVGGAALALLWWRWRAARRASARAWSPGMVGPGGAPMPGPGAVPGGGAGSGMAGAAMAGLGGLAAGMLVERMLHGGSAQAHGHSDLEAQERARRAQDGSAGDGDGGFWDTPDTSLDQRSIDFGAGSSWDAGDSGGDGGGGGDW